MIQQIKNTMLAIILFSGFTASAVNGTDIGSGNNQNICALQARSQVKTILGLHLSKEDMKFFEIRKTFLTNKEQDLNHFVNESYTVTYGFKSGELSWENYDVDVTMKALSSGQCMLKSYNTQF